MDVYGDGGMLDDGAAAHVRPWGLQIILFFQRINRDWHGWLCLYFFLLKQKQRRGHEARLWRYVWPVSI